MSTAFPAPHQDYAQRSLNAKLSKNEKTTLAILARQAFDVMKRAGAIDETADDFRHRISLQACGCRISEARRRHFNDLKAAFLVITGDTAGALNAGTRAQTEDVRIALAKLRAELRFNHLQEPYANHICRSKFKCDLQDATANQLWSLYFDVKKNRKRQRVAASI
jgi:integrase